MQTQNENLPGVSWPTKPLIGQYAKSKPNEYNRTKEIGNLLRQSFDTFHTYGKDASALSTMVKAFTLALEDTHLVDIQAAFQIWLREKEAMPVPAQILSLARECEKYRVAQLEKNKRPASEPAARAPSIIDQLPRVPWYEMSFDEIKNSSMLPQVMQHLQKLPPDRRWSYSRYLINFSKFPKSFFADIQEPIIEN